MNGNHIPQRIEGQLRRAVRTVSAGWFPVNPNVFSSVQAKFQQGRYRATRRELIDDLRGDAALYLLCVRELMRMLQKRGEVPGIEAINLEQADEGVLHEALSGLMAGNALSLSSHSMENISEPQQARLEELVLSSVTAEALAEKSGLSPGSTYSCSLLRQLGVTLLAWNFPHVYAQALQVMQSSERGTAQEFDHLVHSVLGFSPSMLAGRVVEMWGGEGPVAEFVQDSEVTRQPKGVAPTIAELCRVGEAFARANAPDRYPSARADWRSAADVIRRHLGSAGIAAIFRRAREASAHYVAYCPGLETSLSRSEATAKTLLKSGETLNEKNIFISACPEQIRQQFVTFYEKQGDGVSSDVVLREVADRLLPQLGCTGVAILSYEPTSQELVPVFIRGRVATSRVKRLSLRDTNNHLHPARLAFLQRQHVVEQGVSGSSERILYAGSIGFVKRVAVVLVEWETVASETLEAEETAAIFQALRTCLTDLLGLE